MGSNTAKAWAVAEDAEKVALIVRALPAAMPCVSGTLTAGVVPKFQVPADGVFRVEHDLPHRALIIALMIGGFLILALLIGLAVASRSR